MRHTLFNNDKSENFHQNSETGAVILLIWKNRWNSMKMCWESKCSRNGFQRRI